MSKISSNGRSEPAVRIAVSDFVAGDVAMSPEEGDALREAIKKSLRETGPGDKIDLSFAGISIITSSFLNSAVGALYENYSGESLAEKLTVSEMAPEDQQLLKLVTTRAKQYYSDPRRFEAVAQEVLGEG